MKVPLRFQITEFDCGSVALLNAISYLFERDEIPAELVRAISIYTLDCYDEKGNLGHGGTSREAVSKITKWITDYSKEKDFKITCTRLEKEEVAEDKIKECLDNNGVVFARCWQTTEHYILITGMDNQYVYIFDSYYFDDTYYDEDNAVEIIFNKPWTYNRKVQKERVFSFSQKDFSLGETSMRECVLISKN